MSINVGDSISLIIPLRWLQILVLCEKIVFGFHSTTAYLS